MVTTLPFDRVLSWDNESLEESRLQLWSNEETDVSAVEQAVRAERWGELESVDGFFAGVYETQEKLFLFCDRMGVYPLFYWSQNGKGMACPHLPILLSAIGEKPQPCMDGVLSMLLFGHHLADETLFDGVLRCNGGQTVVMDRQGRFADRVNWRTRHSFGENEVSPAEMAELFVEGVRIDQAANSPIVIPLSGGFDSRAVLGATLECFSADRIHTITFGGDDLFDRRVAAHVARTAGVKNTVFPITDEIYDETFLRQRAAEYGYTYSAFATQPPGMLSFLLEQMLQGNVLFWGAGGDAVAGSHLHRDDISLPRCESPEDRARLLLHKRSFLPITTVSQMTGLSESDLIQSIAALVTRSTVPSYETAWQFLDAWDVYVRGSRELIAVLPFRGQRWRCPHLTGGYYQTMMEQAFENKLNQNAYRRMLASRFRPLFELPSRRLKGRSLVGSQLSNIAWIVQWRAARIRESLTERFGRPCDAAGRNYGKDRKFFRSTRGRKTLQRTVETLKRASILRGQAERIYKFTQDTPQAALIATTLAYALDEQHSDAVAGAAVTHEALPGGSQWA